MLEATKRRVAGERILLLGLMLFAAGCSSSSTTAVKLVTVNDKNSSPTVEDQAERAAPFVGQFLQSLSDGDASPDVFTASFKKKIAGPRPGDEDDKKLGYDHRKVAEFLKKIGSGTYETKFTFVASSSGPYILGEVKPPKGANEGFLMHLVPTEKSGHWQVDWFHRSKVFLSYVDDKLSPNLVGAEIAAHCFMDNLLGGDLHLAEATLSKAWKVREYPSSAPSDADHGYNRELVLQKLRGWKGDYSEYALSHRDVVAGQPASFEIIALDAQKNVKKTFAIKVGQDANGDWVVQEIDVR